MTNKSVNMNLIYLTVPHLSYVHLQVSKCATHLEVGLAQAWEHYSSPRYVKSTLTG
jgi:hypothetical protein